MKPSHRKKHKFIWILLVLAIPVFSFFALKSIPDNSPVIDSIPNLENYADQEVLSDDATAKVGWTCFVIPGQCQLILTMKKPALTPSTIIRISGEPTLILGTLGSLKTYVFDLPPGIYEPYGKTLEFYDQINQNVWHSMQLNSL